MTRATRLVTTTLVAALIAIGTPRAVAADQPPAKCKLLSQTKELAFVTHDDRAMEVIVVTTTRRCRGHITTTVQWVRPVDGPR